MPPEGKSALTLPEPSAIEKEVGLQVAHIGLTASGGLVDARFKVLDPARVKVLFSNPANMPMLSVADMPPLMASHHAMKNTSFSAGQIFFILYPNVRTAVKTGADVTVMVGSARLGPIAAQ